MAAQFANGMVHFLRTVTYNNKDVKVHSSFYLRIPIEVVYVWGSVIEEIDVEVKPTL